MPGNPQIWNYSSHHLRAILTAFALKQILKNNIYSGNRLNLAEILFLLFPKAPPLIGETQYGHIVSTRGLTRTLYPIWNNS